MNFITRKLFLFIIITIVLGFSLLFLSRRSSSDSIRKQSFEFIKENEVLIDSVSNLIKNNGITNCNNTFLFFYWRRDNINLKCSDALRNYGKKLPTPAFVKNFFRDNDGNSLSFNSEGVLFISLFHSYRFKKYSLKYFFNAHNLQLGKSYISKYKVVPLDVIDQSDMACAILNAKWILINRKE